MASRTRAIRLAMALLTVAGLSVEAHAQQGSRRFECVGNVTGVPSEALLEITPGGLHTEGPGVAGRIRNQCRG